MVRQDRTGEGRIGPEQYSSLLFIFQYYVSVCGESTAPAALGQTDIWLQTAPALRVLSRSGYAERVALGTSQVRLLSAD